MESLNMKIGLVYHPGMESYRLPILKQRNPATLLPGLETRTKVRYTLPTKVWVGRSKLGVTGYILRKIKGILVVLIETRPSDHTTELYLSFTHYVKII